jgi:hypothetical protein
MRKILFLTLCLCLCSMPVWANSVNWSDGIVHGNMGASLVYADFTVTAKTGLLLTDDPLFIANKAGTIYWGDLGSLNSTVAHVYGLGVQNATPGGSKGISGGGGDANEALVFAFNSPGVDASSVKLTLVGLNDTGRDADGINLFLEFTPVDNPSDKVFTTISFTTPTYTVDFSTLAGVMGNTFGSFAVECTDGHFGVGKIEYCTSTVPVPPTAILLGSGLLGLGFRAWRRKKS